MKTTTLSQDQRGIAHLLVVAIFLVIIAGIASFTYLRIENKNTAITTTDTSIAENEEDVADKTTLEEGQDESEDDPTASLDDEAESL